MNLRPSTNEAIPHPQNDEPQNRTVTRKSVMLSALGATLLPLALPSPAQATPRVHTQPVSLTDPLGTTYPMLRGTRVLTAPGTGGTVMGAVYAGERVQLRCYSRDPETGRLYVFIQYHVDGTDLYKAGYVQDRHLNTGIDGQLPGIPVATPPAQTHPGPSLDEQAALAARPTPREQRFEGWVLAKFSPRRLYPLLPPLFLLPKEPTKLLYGAATVHWDTRDGIVQSVNVNNAVPMVCNQFYVQKDGLAIIYDWDRDEVGRASEVLVTVTTPARRTVEKIDVGLELAGSYRGIDITGTTATTYELGAMVLTMLIRVRGDGTSEMTFA